METGRKKYRVIKDYTTRYPLSIIFDKDERVEVGDSYEGDPDWQNWVRCFAADGREAWCPKQYLSITGDTGRFLRGYDAKELSVHVGELLDIGEELNGFAYAVNGQGTSGWVPLNFLEPEERKDLSVNPSGDMKADERAA